MKITSREFQRFIEEQSAMFISLSPDESEKERILSRNTKLGEEAGEVCAAVLGLFGQQRKSADRESKELATELADVVICAYLLAEVTNVDMSEALATKMAKIRAKHNPQIIATIRGEK